MKLNHGRENVIIVVILMRKLLNICVIMPEILFPDGEFHLQDFNKIFLKYAGS